MDVNVTVLPSLMGIRHMETVSALTKPVLSGATSLFLVQPVLTLGMVAFTAQGFQEESGHMKHVPLQLYLSITNTTTAFNGTDPIVISVLHILIVALDSTMVDLDTMVVVAALGEDATILDLVDLDLTAVVVTTTMVDQDISMVVLFKI
jgi:hypothetical protein